MFLLKLWQNMLPKPVKTDARIQTEGTIYTIAPAKNVGNNG
jgi:hypothetical protein